ncbi:MAG: c-type cytochrome [Luteitalea sp.]|nr:c-type cytochrome [Luteitalea sp.]
MMRWSTFAGFTCFALMIACAHHQGPFTGPQFTEHVRPTDARTPEEQRQGFKLPPGFQIELYASEPDIGKPMNIAFDAKGRLWVTQSREYPFAADSGKGADRITILEDTDADGTADRFTPFADTLNIPIGVLPYNENEAIAYSIPSVYRFADTDGDGTADKQTELLGPFEHKDTHGMVNNLARGYDGWVHACHGFTNESTVAGADGDSIHMISGNTFRFRPDGSRVEHTTYGRINPFGLVYDELGYLYSTDCHTSPLYQLIRGGDYPQWGREEGMGFAPDMKSHGQEATALAGIAYYSDNLFPEEHQRNFYIGDVVASRVYRYSFEFRGSTPVAKSEPDFVLSDDPWFRPVDIKLGPDGALYIADFYNRIIGHYEVPLEHPGRDKARGRIWRVTYKGEAHQERRDWTTASPEELIEVFQHTNLPLRLLAADQLVDRIGSAAVDPIASSLREGDVETSTYVHGLWALHRLDALDDDLLTASATHPDAVVRLHTMRILLEQGDSSETFYPVIVNALDDKDPHVKRAALEILAQYPHLPTLETTLEQRKRAPASDTHLTYTARLVLRNLLREKAVIQEALTAQWSDTDASLLVDVMTGVDTPDAAVFLLAHIDNAGVTPDEQLPRLLQHTARFIPEAQITELIDLGRERSAQDLPAEFTAFKAIRQGIIQRGAREESAFMEWGSRLAATLLDNPSVCEPAREASPEAQQRQIGALELAGDYKLTSLEPTVSACLETTAEQDVKLAAARALLQIEPGRNTKKIAELLQNESEPVEFRRSLAVALGEMSGAVAVPVLASVESVPPGLQGDIVRALATTREGKAIIFKKVREGDIFPRTLLEPQTAERILANISETEQKEYDRLTANVEPVSADKDRLLWKRLDGFRQVSGDGENQGEPSGQDALVSAGEPVFGQHCSPCHQANGKGGLIGPQLTGIGNWGATALAEKVLDPNRNVSEAFRTYTITTKDKKVLSGLFRRDEGGSVVFADGTGKEFAVAKSNIAEQRAAEFSVMPDSFGNALSQEQFNALLAYLLSLQ